MHESNCLLSFPVVRENLILLYANNKSAAGIQHTPPGDIFNAKKIIFETSPFHAMFEENR